MPPRKKPDKLKVYIAGPYTHGDVKENVETAIGLWEILYKQGYTPYCPHTSYWIEMRCHLSYDEWLSYDMEWLMICDVVYRMPGYSPGADLEVVVARREGIPVVYALDELKAIERGLVK